MLKLIIASTLGVILGATVMHFSKETKPPKFYMLLYRAEVEKPYLIPIVDNLDWFLPRGTNPPVITRVQLARPEEIRLK